MAALIKQNADLLAQHFGLQCEHGTGVGGVCQKLAWVFKLACEKVPEGIALWADISNGFNSMRRSAIAEGLAAMPVELQWLRKSFHAFYSGPVPMFFNRCPAVSGIIQCVVGSMQGDPASGIWFNAGLQKAFNQ